MKRAVVVFAVLALVASAAAMAQPGREYLGFEDKRVEAFPVSLGQNVSEVIWIEVVERTHTYQVKLFDGSEETLARFQYFFNEREVRAGSRGEAALIAKSPLQATPMDRAAMSEFFEKAVAAPAPAPVDEVEETKDLLRGYVTTLTGMKGRREGIEKNKICTAIDDINDAIAALDKLPGNEAEIEELLDWAIMALEGLGAAPGSALGQLITSLGKTRACLF